MPLSSPLEGNDITKNLSSDVNGSNWSPSSGTILELNLTDRHFRELCLYAGAVGNLLRMPEIKQRREIAGPLDDLLGAIFAAIQAKRHGFLDRQDRATQMDPVAQRAEQIASGKILTEGKWIAGFHFNNALFRTAAVYDRILQLAVVVEKNDRVPDLSRKAEKLFPLWKWEKLDIIRRQVNTIKHEPEGVYNHRRATFQDAVTAIGELMVLIESHVSAVCVLKKR